MEVPEMPDSCKEGDHNFGQAGRCSECGLDRADTYPTERRTGGSGALTHPTTDREYKEQMRKLSSSQDSLQYGEEEPSQLQRGDN